MSIYTISNQVLKFSVSKLGAEPKSLMTGNREWLVQCYKDSTTGLSPVLFPVIGPLKNNEHMVDGKSYPMPMHGFVKDCVFEVEEKTENSIKLVLKSNDETMNFFPFEFEISITYTLDENHLITEYAIQNTDEKTMFFAIGSHIGFCLNTDKENYTLIFERDMENRNDIEIYGSAKDEVKFVGNTLDIKDNFFKNGAVVIGNHKTEPWRFVNKIDNSYISYKSNDFPYLTLWSIPEQPFICLEPWSFKSYHFCDEPSISDLPGIYKLNAGEKNTFKYVLTFSA